MRTPARNKMKRGQESISEKIITKNEPKYDEKLGQKSLAGHSAWNHKELDTAEHAHTQELQVGNFSIFCGHTVQPIRLGLSSLTFAFQSCYTLRCTG